MPQTDSDNVTKILASFGWYVINGRAEYCGNHGKAQFPSEASEERAKEVTV